MLTVAHGWLRCAMNVVLVHPYINVREKSIALTEPLGLVCLATYLEREFKEINVTILDLYAKGANRPVFKNNYYTKGIDDEDIIKEELNKLKPDIVGLTCCFTGYFQEALDVARITKKFFQNIPIVFGGAHATLEAEKILRDNHFIDYIVRNEGEITFAEFVRAIKDKLPVDAIAGLCYRSADNTVVVNPPRALIENLDVLPIPDRRFIDMEFYKYSNYKASLFSRKSPTATIMTSRGCPYECIFCCTKNMWKRKWRPIGLSKVFEEIDLLKREYGIREFVILDDQFILKKDRVYDFCDHFINEKSNIIFSNNAGISTWLADDDDLLVNMRKAGFYKITLPIESANPETIKFIRKTVDLSQIETLVKKANKLGYWTGAFFVVGFPYETREQIMETISYAYNSDLDFAHFFVAQPYIGTELYEICKKEGLLGAEDVPATCIFEGWHDTLHLKSREINEIANGASKKWLCHKLFYYLKPNNFWNCFLPKFKRPDDFCYGLKVFGRLFKEKIKRVLCV